MRERHPLLGQTLELFSWTHRQEILHLTLILPDGTRALIPAAWTDLDMTNLRDHPSKDQVSEQGTLGSLSDLLHARKVVDSFLRKLNPFDQTPVSPSKEESGHARSAVPLAKRRTNLPKTKHLGGPQSRDTKNSDQHVGQADQPGSLPMSRGGKP